MPQRKEHSIGIDSLRSKTVNALLWSFLESFGLRVIEVVVGIILARLLLPEQFGLIGMVSIFLAVGQSFVKSGFGNALIQKQDANHVDICSVFYFNIVIALVAAIILCSVAPLVADFYKQPILVPLMRVMTLIIVIDSFGVIQNTLLAKRVDFKTLAKRSFLAAIPSGAIGVSLAYAGFGVWSLVFQQLCSSFCMTGFLWWLNKWRPSFDFSLKSLQAMFGFGSRVLLSGLLATIFYHLYSLVIGKLFSAAQLGFYTRARSLAELPSHHLTFMVGRVTFPVFSLMQKDRIRLKNALQKALITLMLVNFPLMIGAFVLARPLVLALLTEKWMPCIPYFRLLCVLGLIFPLNWVNMNALYAIGRSDLCLRVQIAQKTLTVIGLIFTWRWGIQAIIWGQIAVSIISYGINTYYNGAHIEYSIKDQWRDLCWCLTASLLMGVVVSIAGLVPFHSPWFQLLLGITVGVVTYIAICFYIRLPAFLELWQMGWNWFRRKELIRV